MPHVETDTSQALLCNVMSVEETSGRQTAKLLAVAAIALFLLAGCSNRGEDPSEDGVGPDRPGVIASETRTVHVGPKGSIELALSTPAIAFQALSIDTRAAAGDAQIEVARLSAFSTQPSVDPAQNVYQYVQVTHENLDNGAIESVRISFDVGVNWIRFKGLEPDHITLLRYSGGWTRVPTEVISQDGQYVRYEATSPGLSLFAIAGARPAGLSAPSTTIPATPTPYPTPRFLTLPPVIPPLRTEVDELPAPTVSYVGGRFVSANLSGRQITVQPGSTVQVYATLDASAATRGELTIDIRQHVVFAPDRTKETCTNTVSLTAGTQEILGCSFVVEEPSSGSVRHYFITVSWGGQAIYDPNDPGTREYVLTEAPAATLTPTPGITPAPSLTATPVSTPTATPTFAPTQTPTPTPMATPTSVSVATPTAKPTATPVASPTPTPGGTSPKQTATPTARAKAVPKITPPTATAKPTATATVKLTATPTPTRTPTPTPTSVPVDDRFAVVVHTSSKSGSGYFLEQLGVNWYLNASSDMSQVPEGANKLLLVRIPTDPNVWNSGQAETIESLTGEEIAALGFLSPADIAQTAIGNPGAHWYLYGELNRHGHTTGARFAPVFHYFYTMIRLADPTAKIVGHSILNYDFTCIGCAGYQSGKAWLQEFIGEYETKYGEKPPVDVWAINTYPIDWNNTPNNDPQQPVWWKGKDVQHWNIVVDQLVEMRRFIDANGYTNTPLWITEIAVHIGYDGWLWLEFPTKLAPVGTYHWDKMGDYLIAILDWLEANAEANKIEKWFFYVTWTDIVNIGADGYMGMIFFDGPNNGASLNCLGEIYRARSLGEGRWKCDAEGNKVPEQ